MNEIPSHDFDHEYQIQLKNIKATASTKQIDKFKDLARELETNEDEAAFDRVLRKITKKPHTLGEPKALATRLAKSPKR